MFELCDEGRQGPQKVFANPLVVSDLPSAGSDPKRAAVGGGISSAATAALTAPGLIPERISAHRYLNKLLQMPLF